MKKKHRLDLQESKLVPRRLVMNMICTTAFKELYTILKIGWPVVKTVSILLWCMCVCVCVCVCVMNTLFHINRCSNSHVSVQLPREVSTALKVLVLTCTCSIHVYEYITNAIQYTLAMCDDETVLYVHLDLRTPFG